MHYQDLYRQSIEQPALFWKQQAAQLNWQQFPQQILSPGPDGYEQWFADGRLNMSQLCLDRHTEAGRGTQAAIIYDSPVTGITEKISYKQLLDQVARFAAGLRNLGIGEGDTVVIYMPMIPQAIVSMLACARIGAIHSVVFGGFAPHELALRIDDARPKAVITASYGIEVDKKIDYRSMTAEALREARHQPDYHICYRRSADCPAATGLREIDFEAMLHCGTVGPRMVPSTHPLYILYTSGTTGLPKGIVRDTGGYATALSFSMSAFYNTHPGDVFWAASDIGWVVGHSYIVYGPLLQGCTTVLYEGKPVRTPDAGAFWRVVQQYSVSVLFTAPTAIRAIKKEDPQGTRLKQYRLNSLRSVFLAGERCDPPTWLWIQQLLQKPVIDHWWQTESGWPMLGIMTGISDAPPRSGTAGLPVCGYDIRIVSEEGHELAPGQQGQVVVKRPLPPGCLTGLWHNEYRFRQGYLTPFPGCYRTGDGGYRDEDGYICIMGRVDDVINVSGHRLSTGEMEELVASHAAVAECAVVGIADELRGQRPLALVVLKDDAVIAEEQLEEELVQLIRHKIGAVACFRTAVVVQRLPKTRSGKILRQTLRCIADHLPYEMPSTIDDPAILEEITLLLATRVAGNSFDDMKMAG